MSVGLFVTNVLETDYFYHCAVKLIAEAATYSLHVREHGFETRLSVDLRRGSQFKTRRSYWMLPDADASAVLDVCLAQIELEIRATYLGH